MFCCSTTKPHQYHPMSVTVMLLQAGTRKTDRFYGSLEPVFVLMRPMTQPEADGGRRHKSLLRHEVLKICFTWLFQPMSEEEYETENGLNCCSSSTALWTISMNQFSWTDILVLLGYHVDSDARVCRLRTRWSVPQWNQLNISLRLMPSTGTSHHVRKLRHNKRRKCTQLMSKPFCLIRSTFWGNSTMTKTQNQITN